MTIAHEEAARKAYPGACGFTPVFLGLPGLNRRLIGWTFHAKEKDSTVSRWTWITTDHQVSSDLQRTATHAKRMLTSYVANRGAIARGLASAQASGERSVAIGGDSSGIVATGDNPNKEG